MVVGLLKKRPEPKFRIGRPAIIPPEPNARMKKAHYLIVDKRRWVRSTKEWVYSGPLYTVMHDLFVYQRDVDDISEKSLRKMRSGKWE